MKRSDAEDILDSGLSADSRKEVVAPAFSVSNLADAPVESLRDLFAALAMHGEISSGNSSIDINKIALLIFNSRCYAACTRRVNEVFTIRGFDPQGVCKDAYRRTDSLNVKPIAKVSN